MRITHLHLTDFRSYETAQIELGPGVTTLVGRNGHGKTNVIEAVRYLSTLSSHRVATDAPMLRSGASRAVISGRVQRGERALTIEITMIPGKANQARLNRGNAKPRDVVGILRTVVFAPEDLALVKGDPSTRRAFMDELCVAIQPPLAGDLADYDRVLRQRSSLLKSARGKPRFDESTLDIWDEKLADLGARIVHARLAALEALAPHVSRAYEDVAPGEGDCAIAYSTATQIATRQEDSEEDLSPTPAAAPTAAAPTAATPTADIGAALLAAMTERRAQEIERGVCLVGPHRDDVDIKIGDLPAKGYASHGESWSCALALRLGSFALLSDDGEDGEPVLILDDVFAELDSGRRAALAGRVAGAGQVLITAAVEQDVPEQLREHPGGHRVLHVTPGSVSDE
ncbi:DNA replication/repair protein RecF [Demequina sp. TTPB684]|uniref:DNA replication/repair protein RecF n=1 Tax=unclassified Demequina TaxID=2620311 RepID=UPI001CF3AC79|nr:MULTISPECIES: DNA replication/repair protein RecF [unclassified Demequina]MCB2412659.1 DNA replication/repair protein RecF [Demequina sp. TTPB684]UPU87944.1 DNA replication/repair protein RecF [Demequina sp. TMPB413]